MHQTLDNHKKKSLMNHSTTQTKIVGNLYVVLNLSDKLIRKANQVHKMFKNTNIKMNKLVVA